MLNGPKKGFDGVLGRNRKGVLLCCLEFKTCSQLMMDLYKCTQLICSLDVSSHGVNYLNESKTLEHCLNKTMWAVQLLNKSMLVAGWQQLIGWFTKYIAWDC